MVQYDVPALENTSLDDDDNDDNKNILMVILNVLFLELILCIVLISEEIKACTLIQPLLPVRTITVCYYYLHITPPKGYKFYNKIHVKCYFVKLQTHFSQDLFFIGCDIFPQVMVICLHLIKHVLLGLKIY